MAPYPDGGSPHLPSWCPPVTLRLLPAHRHRKSDPAWVRVGEEVLPFQPHRDCGGRTRGPAGSTEPRRAKPRKPGSLFSGAGPSGESLCLPPKAAAPPYLVTRQLPGSPPTAPAAGWTFAACFSFFLVVVPVESAASLGPGTEASPPRGACRPSSGEPRLRLPPRCCGRRAGVPPQSLVCDGVGRWGRYSRSSREAVDTHTRCRARAVTGHPTDFEASSPRRADLQPLQSDGVRSKHRINSSGEEEGDDELHTIRWWLFPGKMY